MWVVETFSSCTGSPHLSSEGGSLSHLRTCYSVDSLAPWQTRSLCSVQGPLRDSCEAEGAPLLKLLKSQVCGGKRGAPFFLDGKTDAEKDAWF